MKMSTCEFLWSGIWMKYDHWRSFVTEVIDIDEKEVTDIDAF